MVSLHSWLESITDAAEMQLARAGVSAEDLTGEGSTSKLTHVVVGRIHFSRTVSQKPPSVSCLHRPLQRLAS